MGKLKYLRSNVKAEPLINKWYAWPMLMSPATHATLLAKHQMPIMKSYAKSPKVHEAACQNVKLRGGPYMDFEGENRVEDVKQLVENNEENLPHLIQLAEDVERLRAMLDAHTDGHSLIPLYEQIPQSLRGYVELYYDTNNNANFKIIESMLYNSKYYRDDLQELLFSKMSEDKRSFVLSTPRFSSEDDFSWKVPFSDPVIDEIFSSQYVGIESDRLSEIAQQYFASNQLRDQFMDLFTEEKPTLNSDRNYHGDDIRIRYLAHASVLVESKNTAVLIDPIVSYRYKSDIERITFEDLPDVIDYVLLTHSHQDHVMFETLLRLRHRIKHIVVPKNTPGALVDPSLKLMLKKIGFKNVIELDELETIECVDGEITSLPFFGEHGDLNIHSKLAYVICLANKRCLFAADSNNIEPKLYEYLSKQFEHMDAIFIGMECAGAPMSWLYGPFLSNKVTRTMDQSRRLNGSDSEKALKLIEQFKCNEVYVYAMGLEPWLSYITNIVYEESSPPLVESNKFLEMCKQLGKKSKRLFGSQSIYVGV